MQNEVDERKIPKNIVTFVDSFNPENACINAFAQCIDRESKPMVLCSKFSNPITKGSGACLYSKRRCCAKRVCVNDACACICNNTCTCAHRTSLQVQRGRCTTLYRSVTISNRRKLAILLGVKYPIGFSDPLKTGKNQK